MAADKDTQEQPKPGDQTNGVDVVTDATTTSPKHEPRWKSPSDPNINDSLTSLINARHSTRVFLPHIPVPQSVLEECLNIARQSPSSTNYQGWQLTFTSGPKLERVREALVAAVKSGQKSTVPPTPDKFRPYRSQVGRAIYGPGGYDIPREDKERKDQAEMRNYEFFDAPMMAVVGIDESLMSGPADVMSVGLYLQTLVLLLTEKGLATCMIVSAAGYGDVLKKELRLPDETVVLCTLAVGYEDTSKRINALKMPRDAWQDHVNFVMD